VIRSQPVLDVLGVLLLGLLRIPDQPVWALTEFDGLLIEPAEHPGRKAHAVWASVVIPVEYLDAPVCRRVRQQGLHVGEHIECFGCGHLDSLAAA
jgi:hypothetical protein